jgi:flagellar hook-basal body complex protein FliE
MNPISALHLAATPELRGQIVSRLGQGGAPAIPASEIDSLQQLSGGAGISGSSPLKPGSFSNVLGSLVQDVSAKQAAAGDAVQGLLADQGVSLHQAMIAMEEANVSFQLMVEVRNKLLESYQELMRMQI